MSYRQLLVQMDRDGAALVSSTTATSLLHAQARKNVPSGFFERVPQDLYVYAAGRISTLATTPGTLTVDLRLGSVVIANGGAMTMSPAAVTNVPWEILWHLTLRSIGGGTAAAFMHQGRFISEAVGATNIAGIAQTRMLPASAPAVGTGFDETVAAALDLFGTWQTSNAANSMQCHQFQVHAAPPL